LIYFNSSAPVVGRAESHLKSVNHPGVGSGATARTRIRGFHETPLARMVSWQCSFV
jgi:hypothetical protein